MELSAESTKFLCIICNKGKGIFKCEGCSRIFCPKHSNDHRNELSKQLEEIAVAHDLIQQTLIQQTEDPRQHLLLKKIDQWEKESIDKIHRMAEEVRNILLSRTVEHSTNIKQKLKHLSDDLRQGREDNDFIETDLRQWTQKLEELKKELLTPMTIAIQEDSTPLVTKIRIDHRYTSDVFERVCGTAEIKENGRLVVKDDIQSHTEIRGKNEYNTGIHTLHFRLEQLIQNGWIFIGIISKSQPMRTNSFYSPSSYGWSNRNQIYVGILRQVNNGQAAEIIQNDAVDLSIDCDQRKIALKNTRLNRTIDLPVDINKCPFPWQFHLNLYEANIHVRILNPSD